MRIFDQTRAVTMMGLRSLPSRGSASLVAVLGVGCMVAVMISLLGMSAGLLRAASHNGRPDRAVVLSAGAASDYMGAIPRQATEIIAASPQVAREHNGRPMAAAAATVVVELTRKTDGVPANAFLRGLPINNPLQTDAFELIEGRMYRPGVRELVVGRAAAEQFKGLEVGRRVTLRGSEWTVVGIFAEQGALSENALMADADTVLTAFQRPAYQSVIVQLNSAGDFDAFKAALSADPRLAVDAKRESEYRAEQLRPITSVLNFVGIFVGSVMGVSALVGAFNTLYSAVEGRSREIATLRAIGFRGPSVVVSVLVEAMALALGGAILGAALAWGLFNEVSVSTVGLSFPLAITPTLLAIGIAVALIVGLSGGLAPAIKAARGPIARGLRAT
jgi:putative ABC transport system permease protein